LSCRVTYQNNILTPACLHNPQNKGCNDIKLK
jgi:hypothetical protein